MDQSAWPGGNVRAQTGDTRVKQVLWLFGASVPTPAEVGGASGAAAAVAADCALTSSSWAQQPLRPTDWRKFRQTCLQNTNVFVFAPLKSCKCESKRHAAQFDAALLLIPFKCRLMTLWLCQL